jgi:hypothetical protein
MTDHLTQGRSKFILFDLNKIWEKIGSMMHIVQMPIRTIHGLYDGFIRR